MLYSRSISEFVVFLEHVCKVQLFEFRVHCIPRTRVQSAAVRAPDLWCSLNTCAKCCRSRSEFIVLFEHVCKVLRFKLRIRRILRIRVQNTAAGCLNSSYSSNTCALQVRGQFAGVLLEFSTVMNFTSFRSQQTLETINVSSFVTAANLRGHAR